MSKKWLFSAYLRDQMTTTEVSMARVYNWDVNRRKAENKPWGACAQAHHFRERRNTRKLEIRNCSSLIKKIFLNISILQNFLERKKSIKVSQFKLKTGFYQTKQQQQRSTHNSRELLCYCSYLFCSKFRIFSKNFGVFLARTSLIFPTTPFRDYFYLFY